MAFRKTKPALGRKTNSRGAVPAFRLILPASLLAATLAIVVSKQVDSPDVGVPWQYKGLITWAFFWAFVDAYSIGANDVANAFANAVGAGTVTHGGACLIACIFEIVGAIALGANVSDTIRTKMVEVKYFYKDPYVLSLGMSMVNLGSGLWVIVATLLGLPVSTTHAVVGAVLGVGITSFGTMGVIWQKEGELGGFVSIVASWFISPALSGAFSAIFYLVVKLSVLKIADDKAAVQRGLLLLPLYLFFVFGTIWGFLFIKGIPTLTKQPLSTLYPSVVSLGIGHAILGLLTVIPWLRRTIIGKENLPWYTLPAVLCIPVGHYKYYKGFFGTSVPCDEKPPSDEDVQKQQAELHALAAAAAQNGSKPPSDEDVQKQQAELNALAAAAAQNGSVHLTSAPYKVCPPVDPGVRVFGSAMGVGQPSNFTIASSHEYTGRASQDVQDLARATSAASHTQAFARANASSLMFIDQVQNEQPKASFADGCLRYLLLWFLIFDHVITLRSLY
jgi:phosphate/sulfate permease